jgi:hypothetical protein
MRASPIFEVALLLAEAVQHGLSALAFCKSRKLSELVFVHARELLSESAPELVSALAVYRAGYSPEARRDLERRLFSGELRGVAATNALELGVVQRRRFFEINGQAEGGDRGVHLGMEINRRGDDDEIEVAYASRQHGAVIGKDLHASRREAEGFTFFDKRIGPRIAGADEFGVAPFFETGDRRVVRSGKPAEAHDGDADGRLHTIFNLGKS